MANVDSAGTDGELSPQVTNGILASMTNAFVSALPVGRDVTAE